MLDIDENMTVGNVCLILADKFHIEHSPDLSLVEHIPSLCIERILEDHELLMPLRLDWTEDSTNKLIFTKTQKYTMFKQNTFLEDLSTTHDQRRKMYQSVMSQNAYRS